VWLAVDDVLVQFGPTADIARANYRQFVHAGIGSNRKPWDDLVGQIFLGAPEWLDTIRDKIALKPRADEHPGIQRTMGYGFFGGGKQHPKWSWGQRANGCCLGGMERRTSYEPSDCSGTAASKLRRGQETRSELRFGAGAKHFVATGDRALQLYDR
jgi:hypothetical protein